MTVLKPQYITNFQGKKISVVLSMKEYNDILEALDDIEDVVLYDEVKAKNEEKSSFFTYLEERTKRLNG